MQRARVERHTLRFPGWKGDQASTYSGCSVAGQSNDVDTGADDGSFGSGLQLGVPTETTRHSKFKDAFRMLKIHTQDISAIAIAPDSAIAECDVWLDGNNDKQRFRVSPGCPLVGAFDSDRDSIFVTIPDSMPVLQLAQHSTTDKVFDAIPITGPANVIDWGFPLRLEVWKGEPLPMRVAAKRGGYRAWFRVLGSATERNCYVCVDGRRRIDVYVLPDAADYTIKVFDVLSAKQPSAPTRDRNLNGAGTAADDQLALDAAGGITLVPASGLWTNIDFYGNPMTVIRVNVVKAAGTGDIQIKVIAWDD